MRKRFGVLSSLSTITLLAWLATVMASGENESFASVSTRDLSVTCVDPTVVAFAPNVSYTVTIPAGTASAFLISNITATAVVTNAINSDGNPSVGVTSGPSSETVVLYNAAPKMKVGGVQCSANSTSTLEMYGDGSDDSNMDAAVASPGATTWASGTTVDDKTSGTAVMLFGASGVVSSQALSDGDDNDGIVNGEIVFGGGGAAANGGFQVLVKVRIFGVNPDNTSESITVKFTPS